MSSELWWMIPFGAVVLWLLIQFLKGGGPPSDNNGRDTGNPKIWGCDSPALDAVRFGLSDATDLHFLIGRRRSDVGKSSLGRGPASISLGRQLGRRPWILPGRWPCHLQR